MGMLARHRVAVWVGLIVVAALVVAACGGTNTVTPDALQGKILVTPQAKADFVLTDTSGESYSFRERTEGRVTLLYFGYTGCPDICPVHLAQIARALEDRADVAPQVDVVFVSVDPNRDSLGDIREYLDHFDSRFIGLTGTADELKAAQLAVGVPPAKYSGEGANYSVDHAGWVMAYAPNGMSYSIYPFGTDLATWVNDLGVLVQMTSEVQA